MEKELISKVTSILEPVAGSGKVHANASVDVDFNSSEQTEETYNPTPPPVISSQQKSEERVGSTGTPSGIPGTRSNQGDAAAQPAAGAPDRSRQNEVTNYEVSKLVRHTVQPKGSVQRLSVAVLLDHKSVYSKGADGKQVVSFQPRPKEELDVCRQLVLAAIGFNETRGDTVTLENIPFFSAPAAEEDRTPVPWYIKWQGYLLPGMKYLAFIVLFLLAYFLLVRPVRRRIFQSIGVAPAPRALPAGNARQLGEGGSKTGAAAAQGIPALAAGPQAQSVNALTSGNRGTALDADIEQELLNQAQMAGAGTRKYDILKQKVVEHVTNDPEQVSQLIRAWMNEKS
jgi:flagellar biosynthesis/type III secretory pathway M-ring protein FliF/YscJ